MNADDFNDFLNEKIPPGALDLYKEKHPHWKDEDYGYEFDIGLNGFEQASQLLKETFPSLSKYEFVSSDESEIIYIGLTVYDLTEDMTFKMFKSETDSLRKLFPKENFTWHISEIHY